MACKEGSVSDPKKPKPGDLAIDASDAWVVDLQSGSGRRMNKLHEGHEKAVDNLLRLKPAEIERAGLDRKAIERLITLKAEKERVAELLPASEKLTEVLRDTDLQKGHDMAIIIGEQAARARRRAKRAPDRSEILGPLDDLLKYQYGPAAKAVATRAKKGRSSGSPK
jgi:hypothetical protein